MSCIYCNADMHFICVEEALEGKNCCCEGEGFVGEPIKQLLSTRRGRPHITDGSKLADVLTTGRHRAAVRISKEYLAAQHVCSWAGLAAAGGGVVPIIGCPGNIATDRHHGPNKSVLDNDDNYVDFGHNLHAICRYCITGDMRLLTENLRWVRADKIQVGDKLVGFSENLKLTVTKFEPAVVESVSKVIEPGIRITMKNGDMFTVSHGHKWAANRPGDRHIGWYRTEQFFNKYSTGNHFALKKLFTPWESENTWEAGWLAGFLDGEGSLSGTLLTAAQSTKASNSSTVQLMSELFEERASHVNIQRRAAYNNNSEAIVVRIAKLVEILELLGRVRPQRLLEKIPKFLYESGKKNPISIAEREEILHVEWVGDTEFYSIQTSTGTYVTEGYLSHNCHARWHGNNDKYYRPEGWVKGDPEPRPPNGEPWFPREPFKYTDHDPTTKATDTDIKIHESWWKLRTEEREEIGTFAEWRSQFTVSEDTDDGGLVGIPEPTDYPAIGS